MSVRRVGRSAIIYGLQPVLSRLVSFVMLPVYTRYLTTADYGVLQLLGTTVEIITILFTAGAISGVGRFYFKYETEHERRRLLSTAWLVQCMVTLSGAAALLLVAPLIHRYVLKGDGTVGLVRLAALNLATGVLAAVPMLRLRITEQAALYSGSSLARLVLQLSLNILFVVSLGYGVQGPLLSTLITNVLFGGILAFVMLRDTGLHWDGSMRAQMAKFGRPSRLTSIGSFILNFGDRYFLAASWSTAVVGMYGLAYQFGFGFSQFFVGPLANAWDPIRYQMGNKPREEWESDYLRVFDVGNLIYLTGFTAVVVFIAPFIRLLTTPAFYGAAGIVAPIVAAYVVQGWTATFVYQINMAERPSLYARATTLSIAVVLVLYALLIPRFGAAGAAWATLGAFSLRCVLTYRAAQEVWPIAYRFGPVSRLLALALAAAVAAQALHTAPMAVQIWAGVLLLAAFLTLSLTTAVDADIRRRLLAMLQGWWHRSATIS